jgi:hypothetical protein
LPGIIKKGTIRTKKSPSIFNQFRLEEDAAPGEEIFQKLA